MATQEAARMPFGKHKNKPIGEIDPTYLEWVLANCQQISPDLKRAICTQLGLEVKDDPKDREIAELHASIQELRQRMLVSRLEAYDQGYKDGKSGGQANCIRDKVREWHRSLAQEYQGSTEAMTAVNDAYDRLRKALEFKDDESIEFVDSDQKWITLEDYCLERDLLLDHSQLIKEGLAIARHLRTNGSPPPHKLPHDRYGLVNGYRRCTLDGWYEEFVGRKEVKLAPHRSATATTRRRSRSRIPHPGRSEVQFDRSPDDDHRQSAQSPGIPVICSTNAGLSEPVHEPRVLWRVEVDR